MPGSSKPCAGRGRLDRWRSPPRGWATYGTPCTGPMTRSGSRRPPMATRCSGSLCRRGSSSRASKQDSLPVTEEARVAAVVSHAQPAPAGPCHRIAARPAPRTPLPFADEQLLSEVADLYVLRFQPRREAHLPGYLMRASASRRSGGSGSSAVRVWWPDRRDQRPYRSDPHTQPSTTRTTASAGSWITGSGRSPATTAPGPLNIAARIAERLLDLGYLQWLRLQQTTSRPTRAGPLVRGTGRTPLPRNPRPRQPSATAARPWQLPVRPPIRPAISKPHGMSSR